ncbi:acyl-CoA dehydrogenase family protein [Kocuria rhizophila]|nr:acyl-CoA dehydrogenase family protein [Kocuria rhizophila]
MPIANYQLVQERLATMLSDLTSLQLMCTRMAQLQESDQLTDAMASLVKMTTCKALDMCRTARDMLGAATGCCWRTTSAATSRTWRWSPPAGTDSVQALIVAGPSPASPRVHALPPLVRAGRVGTGRSGRRF